MKKVFLLATLFLLLAAFTQAQYVSIPDNSFRKFLKAKYPTCFNGASMMDTTCSSIINEDSLVIKKIDITDSIKVITGIQYFKSLTYLNCSFNYIKILSDLPPSLTTFICEGQYSSNWQLTSITSLPTTLTYFSCNGNGLTTLPALPPSLAYLSCSLSRLSSLPTLPASLTYLNCSKNYPLKTLPSLPPSLTELWCDSCSITTLPTLPPSLTYLNCGYNYKIVFPSNFPSSSLAYLICPYNGLRNLPALPASLTYLNCSRNGLEGLPDLPESLSYLDCYGQSYYDNLTAKWVYPFKCLPTLPISLKTLNIDTVRSIKCLPNYGLFKNTYNLPLCQASSGCPLPTSVSGNVFYDMNNDGIKNGNDFFKANIKVLLSNGTSTYTDNNGHYFFSPQSGDYTVSVIAPDYYVPIPGSVNFTYSSSTKLNLQDIALQANQAVDSLLISVTPVNAAARPGFKYPILITYENAGTTTVTPAIVLNYDDQKLNYDSSSDHSVINSGNQLSLAAPNIYPGQRKSFIAYFKLKVTATLGDTLRTKATISINSVTAKDSCFAVIRGSFDPNDKQATPLLTPLQVMTGKAITYTIRFQNTGTDTAFNVIVADTLSALLQKNTFELLSTSHNCSISFSGNIVFFKFFDILLPDSNITEPLSHGFITYKIKPQNFLSSGTNVPNKAAIYFDYNLPIITNTATTLIQDPIASVQTYTFTGNGNWSDPANWSNSILPPATITSGVQILIDHVPGGECFLDVEQTVEQGSVLVVKQGKKLRLMGNLIIK
ncbi:MAG: hypothetical protein V4556_08175 [Bacteroidota bacterium]